MSAAETYLNHPTFGLLFRVCEIETSHELFTTLYAQRLFFRVTIGEKGTTFEPITRSDARILVENRLRFLKRNGSAHEYGQLQLSHRQTFL
jgi:PII interaction protein X